MANQQAGFFAAHAREHDTKETEKLVEKGEVQARLRLRGGNLECAIATKARCFWRLQEQAPVCIESSGLGREYDDL